MGLFGDLIKLGVDVVTTPLDAIADVSEVLEGQEPRHIEKKIRTIGNDVADGVRDITRLDL